MGKMDANHGGCWFCETDDTGEWMISFEFDCNVHVPCLKQAFVKDYNNEEAKIMMREYLIEVEGITYG